MFAVIIAWEEYLRRCLLDIRFTKIIRYYMLYFGINLFQFIFEDNMQKEFSHYIREN